MDNQLIEEVNQVAEVSANIDWLSVITLVVSIVAAIGSVAAVITTIVIANSQKRISLLEIRLRILEDMDKFINQVLPNWSWDGSMYPYCQHTKEQVRILFDDELESFFEEIDYVASRCAVLRGDENYAREKGECHGKEDYEIEDERLNIEKDLSQRFKEQKDRAYKRWIKV